MKGAKGDQGKICFRPNIIMDTFYSVVLFHLHAQGRKVPNMEELYMLDGDMTSVHQLLN